MTKPISLSRGELARETGINSETILYYEKSGFLPAPLGLRADTGSTTRRIFRLWGSSSAHVAWGLPRKKFRQSSDYMARSINPARL